MQCSRSQQQRTSAVSLSTHNVGMIQYFSDLIVIIIACTGLWGRWRDMFPFGLYTCAAALFAMSVN